MGLKKYIISSILLVLVVFGYTFSIEAGDYRLEILDYTFLLPVAVWVVVPTLFLFVVSVFHILFYGLKNYFELKSFKKDANSLSSLINKRLLKSNSSEVFKNKDLKEIGQILSQLDFDITKKDFKTNNSDIENTIKNILTIRNGEPVSAKALKLDNNNVLMIDNILNQINNDKEYALDVVKSSTKYADKIVKSAFLKVIETKSITTIKKYIDTISFDKDLLISLFTKDSEQKSEFAMTNEVILKLIKKVDLDNTALIEIANIYKTTMTPDQIIKLYEDLITINEKYTTAYLYVLAQYEMIDKMRDILDNSSSTDYIPFKALVDLKDAGKHTYSLDTLCIK